MEQLIHTNMRTEIEDIIRSTLVIQNKQSLGLCAEKIVKHLESQKCTHPYSDIEQTDMDGLICRKCNKKLTD